MSARPECADHACTPVTVMLTPEQATRLEVWLAGQRDNGLPMDDNDRVDFVFEMGLSMIEHMRTAPNDNPALIAIQRELAYSAARADIECLCLCASFDCGWYQTAKEPGDENAAVVNLAVRYLAALGLIETRPDIPGAVRVRELETTP